MNDIIFQTTVVLAGVLNLGTAIYIWRKSGTINRAIRSLNKRLDIHRDSIDFTRRAITSLADSQDSMVDLITKLRCTCNKPEGDTNA